MPRGKKNPSPKPPRRCALCDAEFTPRAPSQVYCDEHKNRHQKRMVDRRRLGTAERPADYYRPKACWECGDEFVPRTGSARYCEACKAKGDRWKRNNPAKALAASRQATRRHRHKREFGDPDVYDKAVARFGERCAICKYEPEEGFHLAVDHSHTDGAIRGLLCGTCNTGLGYFDDDPRRLRAAASYLTKARPT